MSDAWARVLREMSDVAGKTPGQLQRWQRRRGAALLRYHARQGRNHAYRELIQDAGVDPASSVQTSAAWDRVPVVDKQWLAKAGYERQPACPGPVLIVATSGSTATRVLVPVTAECANRGLGDNFLRTLAEAAEALIIALRASGEPLRRMGDRDAQALAAGPLIGLLTSTQETKAAWTRAGLAWQHLALTAHTFGLAVAPLTAIVENPQTREAASAHAPAGQHLQMLFRLGRSPGPLPPTPRRDPTWVTGS